MISSPVASAQLNTLAQYNTIIYIPRLALEAQTCSKYFKVMNHGIPRLWCAALRSITGAGISSLASILC